MQTNKVFQNNLWKDTLEQTTATVVAESAGNYAGKSFKYYGVNKTGTSKGYQVYFIDNAVGTDPTIGTFTSDSITWRADVGGNYASTYITVNDGTSTVQTNYYIKFTVGGVGYDPKIGLKNATQVVTVADSSRSLSGKYFLIKAGANVSYYVWYLVSGGSNTDPAPGGTGLPVYINQNDTAYQVAYNTQQQLTGSAGSLFTAPISSTSTIVLTNIQPYTVTAAGAGNSGFTVTTPVTGVSPIGALATVTLLKSVDITSGDTAANVGTKFVAAMNGYAGWTASGTSPSTLVHPTRGNCTATADGNVTGLTITPTAGADPTTSTFESIPVSVASAATAATIQAAIVAAINARCFDPINNPTKYTTVAAGSQPTLSITNIWPNNTVTATANVDSPLTTWTRAVTGTAWAAGDNNLGGAASGVNFTWKPNVTEVLYLREISIEAWVTSLAAGNLWGTGTALTNGIVMEIVAKDGTQVCALTPKIRDNTGLLQLGFGAPSAIGANAIYNLFDAFGGEVPIDGRNGQYIRILTADSLAGWTTQYFHLRGHFSEQV